jgi:gamma-glutamyltranspeptidase/glutathione hydrolase
MKVRRKALARTLSEIRKKRSAGFYQGPVARDIVTTVKRHGGVLTSADLAGYKVAEREPLIGRFRGLRVATMPLPSSGGIALLQTLGMLDASGHDLKKYGHGSSLTVHLIIELLKHAFADRARFLGDSQPASLAKTMLAPERLRRLAKKISTKRVRALPSYGDKKLGAAKGVVEDGGTSHLCVVDKDGNAVALTSTVNLFFGSGLVTDKSGIVLNNEVDDFAIEVGKPNAFGLVQSKYNLVGPGKRPLSSMTPTLVLDDNGVVACAGGSGGPRIISNTIQTLLNVLIFDMNAREAVSASRIHHQWQPDRVLVEPDMVDDVRKALRKKGHKLKDAKYSTAVQMIVVDEKGVRQGASDPRKGGRPAAEDMR